MIQVIPIQNLPSHNFLQQSNQDLNFPLLEKTNSKISPASQSESRISDSRLSSTRQSETKLNSSNQSVSLLKESQKYNSQFPLSNQSTLRLSESPKSIVKHPTNRVSYSKQSETKQSEKIPSQSKLHYPESRQLKSRLSRRPPSHRPDSPPEVGVVQGNQVPFQSNFPRYSILNIKPDKFSNLGVKNSLRRSNYQLDNFPKLKNPNFVFHVPNRPTSPMGSS